MQVYCVAFIFNKVRYKEVLIVIVLLALSIGGYWIVQFIEYKPLFKIGVNACSGAEYLQIALEQKYFEKAGLRVRFAEFGSLQDVQQAFEWRQIEAMICPFVDAMVMQCKSATYKPKVVLFTSFTKKQFPWCLMAGLNIKSVKDLQGKKIGIEINSFSNYVLCRALRSVGLSLQDVVIVPVDPTAHMTFLQNEKVDCIVTYWPFSNDLKNLNKELHCIYSTEDWPREMKLNVLLVQQQSLNFFRRNLIKFISQWDEILSIYKQEYINCRTMIHPTNLPDYHASLKTIYPLFLSDQIPLLCNNRYILDLMEDIKSEMLMHNHLGCDTKFELMFDSSVIRNSLKK